MQELVPMRLSAYAARNLLVERCGDFAGCSVASQTCRGLVLDRGMTMAELQEYRIIKPEPGFPVARRLSKIPRPAFGR
jgi:hypothetical protein